MTDTVSDDQRSWTWRPDPVDVAKPVFIPAREGKSLTAHIKKRFFFKRKIYDTWSDE